MFLDAGGQERRVNPEDMLKGRGIRLETVWPDLGYKGWSEKPRRNFFFFFLPDIWRSVRKGWGQTFREGYFDPEKKIIKYP